MIFFPLTMYNPAGKSGNAVEWSATFMPKELKTEPEERFLSLFVSVICDVSSQSGLTVIPK